MNRTASIVGVPMDLGTDRRGVDMGPSAIRYGGLADHLERIGVACGDRGDLTVPRPEGRGTGSDASTAGRAKYLAETRTVCERLAEEVAEVRDAGNVPLVLGGDHSIAIGTASGVADEPTGLLWIDAHGDFNTPGTTPSGNVHGMPLAAILGLGEFADQSWAHTPNVAEENVALVGLRSVDAAEKELISDSDVTAYTMSDIDERGTTTVVNEALAAVTDGVEQFGVSFDLDVVDPSEAPGVGTPVRGGVSYREAHAAMERIHAEDTTELCSLELVEVNPILDQSNRTAELACELAASALGDRVL